MLILQLQLGLTQLGLLGQFGKSLVLGPLDLLDPCQPFSLHGLDLVLIFLLDSLDQPPFLLQLLKHLMIGHLVLLNPLESLLNFPIGLNDSAIVVNQLILLELIHEGILLIFHFSDLHLPIFLQPLKSFLPPDHLPTGPLVLLLQETHPDDLLLNLPLSILKLGLETLLIDVVRCQ